MSQERILGFNDIGEEKWHEGGHLPAGWYFQDPTKAKVDPKGTEYPDDKDDGPQDEPEVETHEIAEADIPKGLPMSAPVAEEDMKPKLIPDPPPPQVKKEEAAPVVLDEDGDEPMPPPVEKPKAKTGKAKKKGN